MLRCTSCDSLRKIVQRNKALSVLKVHDCVFPARLRGAKNNLEGRQAVVGAIDRSAARVHLCYVYARTATCTSAVGHHSSGGGVPHEKACMWL